MSDYKISLEAARVNAHLRQTDIALKMNVSRQTVANWENGKVKPKIAQLKMFCDICSVPEDIIFLQ